MHSFSFNLVSLSRLTDSAHLLVLFHDFWCFIKDQLSRRMIGSPRKCHGLYYLCDTSPPSKPASSTSSVFNSTSTSSVSYLWHARLGLQNLRNKQARFSCSGHQARKWLTVCTPGISSRHGSPAVPHVVEYKASSLSHESSMLLSFL